MSYGVAHYGIGRLAKAEKASPGGMWLKLTPIAYSVCSSEAPVHRGPTWQWHALACIGWQAAPGSGTGRCACTAPLAGLVGAQAVLFSTSLSILARKTLAGDNQLASWFTAVLVLGLAACATFWVARLNQASAACLERVAQKNAGCTAGCGGPMWGSMF